MDALYAGNYLEAGIQFLTCAAEVFTFGMASEINLGTKTLSSAAETSTSVVEDLVSVYHKGLLNNGVVSSTRSLSTGLERASVEALERSGQVWEFRIPRTEFLKWKYEGAWESFTDMDKVTGVLNQEIRFSPRLAPKLNQYIVKP